MGQREVLTVHAFFRPVMYHCVDSVVTEFAELYMAPSVRVLTA